MTISSVTKSLVYFGLVLLSSFLVASFSVSAQDVAVCGGFVIASPELRAKSSGVQVDYSLIKVKLKTRNEGLLKDASECAPTGYYSVPVYDKGQFVLEVEGPAGWNFEPKAVDVVIDANNQCQGGQDINFAITGFKVQGSVRSEACESEKDAATKGITITLKSTDSSVSRTTTTVAGGRYEFTNVAPGSYVVEATHPQWSLASKSNPTPSKKSSTNLKWAWDNAKVQEDFLVTGFDISGQVTSESNEALSGVEFLLYSKTPSKRESLPCIGSSSPSTANDVNYPDGRPLCLTKSTESGFRFENVPCGQYRIVPYYRGTHTTFDLVPKQVDVVVKGGESVTVSPAFKVTGFSVVGKVVDARGQGVADAKILVNGKEKTKTGADGSYKLEQMASGEYKIEASKDHVFFSQLAKERLTPAVPQLPNIIANAYHLCGKVEIAQAPAGVSASKSRTIVIKGAATKTATTDASGNFCAVVTPGRYTISVQLDKDEIKAGLLLQPAEQVVTIQDAPVLDIKFGQSLLSVSGSVTCLEKPCHSSLSVVLTSVDRNYRVSSALTGDKFTFRSVLPGKYKASVEIANWCWRDNQDTIQFEVVSSDVTNLEFVQSGYKVSIRSPSNEIKLSYKSGKERGEAVPLKKGNNEFCVATPGVYDLSLASCFKFEKDAYKFDTRNPAVVDLGTQNDPKMSVKVKRDSDDSVLTELIPTLVNTRKAEQTTFYTYQYTHWAVLGEELRFIPASALLLFYPTRYTDVSVLKGGECPPAVTPFTARPGLFLKGKISPPLGDAIIKVFNKDNLVLVETKSVADGSYSAGPLYDDQEYTVTAERENYQFVKTNEGFNANKLGQIQIAVTDEATKEPLQGVLLSLSGSDGYRSNTVTNAQGIYRFLGINPGDYFVRLTLKEYVFVPASKSIKVNQGEDVNVSFEAKRVAFSAYGFVQTLNGEPEKSVTIEATGPNGEYEETQTDVKGQFRIRGLVPKVTYTLRVKNNAESKVERASPLEQKVTIPESGGDVKDIKFIIFKRSPTLQITGVVASKREWLNKLKVELYREDELVKTISLGPSNYFDFHSLVLPKGSKAKYTLRLKSSLPREQYVYELSSADVEFGPGETQKQVNLSFEVAPHILPQELVSTPFWALLFGLIPILGIFYPQKVLSLAQKIASGKAFEKPQEEVAFGKDPDLAYHRQIARLSKKQGAKGGRK